MQAKASGRDTTNTVPVTTYNHLHLTNIFVFESITPVIQSWACSKASEPASMQSFPATTRLALKNGCLTAKSQHEFGKQFPVMNHSLESSQNKAQSDGSADQQSQEIFGIQSRENEVGMMELLLCIPSELEEERDYPELSGKHRRKGRVPQAKATNSSLSVAKCRGPPSEEEIAKKKSVEEFKLTKFKKVPSKVKRYM